MQRILWGAAGGFALLFLAPEHKAATLHSPAHDLNNTIRDRMAQLDPRELNCLALNIYYEARGERPAGQLAVAHVTLNRLHDPRFPKTICKVVFQPSAFSWTADPQNNREAIHDKQAWDLAGTIAQMTMVGMTNDPTNGAMDFHATWIHPWWTADKELIGQLGHHKFYARQSMTTAASNLHSPKHSKATLVRKMRIRTSKQKPVRPPKSLSADRRTANEELYNSVNETNGATDPLGPASRDLQPLKEHG